MWSAYLLALLMAAAPDVYIRSTARSPSVVETVVGNSGASTNMQNFDAYLLVQLDGREICRIQTNFVTPLDAGMAVVAFRVAGSDGAPPADYVVSAHIRFWERSKDAPDNNQHSARYALPGKVSCVAEKPPQ